MARTKFKGPFGLIREFIKYVDHIKSIHLYRATGILEIVLAGRVVMTAEIIEGMKKSGYMPKISYNSVDPEAIESNSIGDFLSAIRREENVPNWIHTTLRFEDTELPQLANERKSDIQALITEPRRVELAAADSGCNAKNTESESEDAGNEEEHV